MPLTEDQIRDRAKEILGFEDSTIARSGVGQLTTFNQLGFRRCINRPDGWYLPNDRTMPAIILETKREGENISPFVNELLDNCRVVLTRYNKVIGILYNGDDIKVYKNLEEETVVSTLQNKEYYLGLFETNTIDKQMIYRVTKRINDSLHFNFGIKNLYHRMIFTACALVAKRFGASLTAGMSYNAMSVEISTILERSYSDELIRNPKLSLLKEVFLEIRPSNTDNQEAINVFITNVSEISDLVNSDFWNGEDVMAIFFNEFTRYKGKSEHGQVFTPDNITSFMYRLVGTNKDDLVLDAACGSGAFLVKSMCNMIKEAGGNRTRKASIIKSSQIFGIEMDREIYALACANMLIHKDGKTNLAQLDTRSSEAGDWIAGKGITKVLMNPPFERKYGCLEIVQNVLDNVPRETTSAFILPDNKLDKNPAKARKILRAHKLEKIIKLPEKTFSGTTTSIFIFKAGVPQNNSEIFTCYVAEDGLRTIKNQGRQDVDGAWPAIEDYWVDVINRHSGDASIKWIKPNIRLSYPMPRPDFSLKKSELKETLINYLLYENQISKEDFKTKLINSLLFSDDDGVIKNAIRQDLNNSSPDNDGNNIIDVTAWRRIKIEDEFIVETGASVPSASLTIDGNIPRVTARTDNNGIGLYTSSSSDSSFRVDGNCVSVSFLGSCFYQPIESSYDMKIHHFKPRNSELNKFSGLFLATICNKEFSIFTYGGQINSDDLRKQEILLPVTTDGHPDFAEMERIMREVESNDIPAYIQDVIELLNS